MKEKLQLPFAEKYEIKYPQNCKKRRLHEYIEKQLKGLHPGFSSDSLWDYVVITKGNEKIIKTVVLDKNYYIEKRIKNKKVDFYTEEKNKIFVLFKSNKFSKTGKKKNSHLFLYTVLYCLVFCTIISLVLLSTKNDNKTEEIVEKNEEKEIPEVCNILDIINFTAEKIYEEKGIVTSVSYSLEQNAKISFVINNCEPFVLINKILVNTQIQSCFCSNVTYKNSSESFEIQMVVPVNELLMDQKNGLELLEKQKDIISEIKQENIQVLNSSINQDYCKESFTLCVNRNDLGKTNNILADILIENSLLLTSFNEHTEENNLCIIEFEVALLSNKQSIKQIVENESLSKVMYVAPEIKVSKHINTVKTGKKEIKEETKNIQRLTKIGSVVKNGNTIFYYRTEDGKIYTSEEEL